MGTGAVELYVSFHGSMALDLMTNTQVCALIEFICVGLHEHIEPKMVLGRSGPIPA